MSQRVRDDHETPKQRYQIHSRQTSLSGDRSGLEAEVQEPGICRLDTSPQEQV